MLPFYATAVEVVVPPGWKVTRIVDAYVQLPVGQRYDSKSVVAAGAVPVIDQSVDGVLGYHNDEPGVVATEARPVVTFANHTCAMRVMKTPFSVIQNVFPLVGRPGICDTKFLYYATHGRQRTEDYKGHHPAWRNSFFAVPGLRTQRQIVAVLVVLDDLIENNRRRVEMLEEMARAIYREWFVHFRYPGHQDVPLVDSPLGPIPDGWEITSIGDRFDVVLGGTPSRRNSAFWTHGTIPWINSGRVNDLRVIQASELITQDALQRSNAQVMPCRSTLLAITGATLGQVSLLEIEACANQSVIGLIDRRNELGEFLYLDISNRIDSIISKASGGAQQHVNKSIVCGIEIPLPAPAVSYAFSELVNPVFDLMADLLRQNVCLVETRDMLLPKLVTGRIDVSSLDLEAVLETGAA